MKRPNIRSFFASGNSVDPQYLLYHIHTEGICITNGLPDINTIAQLIKSIFRIMEKLGNDMTQ